MTIDCYVLKFSPPSADGKILKRFRVKSLFSTEVLPRSVVEALVVWVRQLPQFGRWNAALLENDNRMLKPTLSSQ